MRVSSLQKMRLLSDQDLINILQDEQNHKVRTFNMAYTVAIERGLTSFYSSIRLSENSNFSYQLVVSDSNVNTLDLLIKTSFNYQSKERIILENALTSHSIKFDLLVSEANSVQYKAFGVSAEEISSVLNKALLQKLINPPIQESSYRINWIKGILIVSTLVMMLVVSFLVIHILAFYIAIK
jgi:hypothetical protein